MSCPHFSWIRTGWGKMSDPLPIDIWYCEDCGEEGWHYRHPPLPEGIPMAEGVMVPQGYPYKDRLS